MKSRLALFATAVVALLAVAWLRHRIRPAPPSPVSRTAPAFPATGGRPAAPPAPAPAAVVDPRTTDAPSHLADDLNSATGDIHADLRTLDEIFRQFRSSVHGMNPVGDNLDISRVLTGRNAVAFAFIPQDNPAINAQGEICDRWGTPFFFHQLSGSQMEIRSAGPDRKLWTADDEVLTPGPAAPPR